MNIQDAQSALSAANGKLVRGRKITVTYAQQAPLESMHPSMVSGKTRKAVSDAGRPTALSLLKTGESTAGKSDGCAIVLILFDVWTQAIPHSTKNKIALMEAKLKQMARTPASSSQGHRPPSSRQPRSHQSPLLVRPAPPKPSLESLSKQSIFPRTQPSTSKPKS